VIGVVNEVEEKDKTPDTPGLNKEVSDERKFFMPTMFRSPESG
jgi:hypothetical protein